MKVLVTGSTGLIGSALVNSLSNAGHSVTRLVRTKPRPGQAEVHWDPARGVIDRAGLEGFEAVVHLAGESLARRWTQERKVRMRDSRIKGTKLLSQSLAQLAQPPRGLICASAIGYYGNRGDELLREESPPGAGFLSTLCVEWEAAAEAAVQKGIRVVHFRLGLVLSAAGGALAKMLLPFKMGLGGRIGDGKQWMSWIALDDLLAVIHLALSSEAVRGPVNAVAPNPVTNLEFTKTLGHVLGRLTPFPLPAFAARLILGEMAEELLLSSTRVEPARLSTLAFKFRFPQLEGALRHVLGKA